MGTRQAQPPEAEVDRQSPAAGLHQGTCVRHAAPRVSLGRPRHPVNWYYACVDKWTEVAKHLCVRDLLRLSGTCRWFRGFIRGDDSLWRYAFNGSHAYWFRQSDRHIEAWRIGGFLLGGGGGGGGGADLVLSAILPLPIVSDDGVKQQQSSIETTGACVVSNARTGVWLAAGWATTDMHLVGCTICHSCDEKMQVLDARHSDVFLEAPYKDGTLEYKDLGQHSLHEEPAAAFCGVFSRDQLASAPTARLLNVNSWIGERSDLHAKRRSSTYAAAVYSNLTRNRGLLSRFEAIRDSNGLAVSIRISQVAH